MKIVIESLAKSAKSIFNLLLISVTFLMLFGILGTFFYSGLFWTCHTANIPEAQKINTMWECFDYGGEWVNPDATMDNIFDAMKTMFEIITTEGWKDVMYQAVDARGYRMMPQENYSPSQQLFFVCFMVLGSLFMLNLFVGVVIDNFNLEKEKIHRKDMLTPK